MQKWWWIFMRPHIRKSTVSILLFAFSDTSIWHNEQWAETVNSSGLGCNTLIQTFQVRNVIKFIWHYLSVVCWYHANWCSLLCVYFSTIFFSLLEAFVIDAVICFRLSIFRQLFNEDEKKPSCYSICLLPSFYWNNESISRKISSWIYWLLTQNFRSIHTHTITYYLKL